MVNCKKQQNKYDTASGFTLIKKIPPSKVHHEYNFYMIPSRTALSSIARVYLNKLHYKLTDYIILFFL